MEDRQIQLFHYWRDRLVILKEAYDEATPKTLKQFWRDRRDRVPWYTFWVGLPLLILGVIFGVVQSVEGGYQAWRPS
jgi:hypothetical protein